MDDLGLSIRQYQPHLVCRDYDASADCDGCDPDAVMPCGGRVEGYAKPCPQHGSDIVERHWATTCPRTIEGGMERASRMQFDNPVRYEHFLPPR